MKFKFDHHQDFQLEAINAIAGLFAGQPREEDIIRYGLQRRNS
jgi:hypothetical protein